MRAADRVGSVVAGKYRLDALLGEGGMGAVFQATHLVVGKRFAIKLLHAEVSKNPDAKRRFTQEAQAASRIGHPGILDVYDLGETDEGGLYMVMELLLGESLADRLRAGPLPVKVAVRHAIAMLTALEAAHGASIIHRDVKPANVFLVKNPDGTHAVRVLDFGIAKFQEPVDGAHTSTGAVLGSPYYMAPEQVRAEKEIDARADVWAVGATLYELLVGEPAHTAPTHAAVIAKIVLTPAPLASARRPEVDEHLDAIVARALAIDPETRWGSAAEMRDALDTYLAGNASTLMSDPPPAIARSERARDSASSGSDSGRRARSGSGGYAETPRAVVSNATTDKSERARARSTTTKVATTALLVGVLGAAAFVASSRARATHDDRAGSLDRGAAATRDPSTIASTASAAAADPASSAATPTEAAIAPPGTSTPLAALTPTRDAGVAGVTAIATSVASAHAGPGTRGVAAPTPTTGHRVSAARACPAGEAPTTGGHCCPTGLTWQAGRCERDIATAPPF